MANFLKISLKLNIFLGGEGEEGKGTLAEEGVHGVSNDLPEGDEQALGDRRQGKANFIIRINNMFSAVTSATICAFKHVKEIRGKMVPAKTTCISVKRDLWTWTEWLKVDKNVTLVPRLRRSLHPNTTISEKAFKACSAQLRKRRGEVSTILDTRGLLFFALLF